MAVTLDSVILELEARVGEYNTAVANSANNTERAMQRITTAATSTERQLGRNRIGLQQLSFQLNDVATMWLMGANPMQIFVSQGGQVVQVLQNMSAEANAAGTSLTKMATGGLVRMGPYLLAGAAAGTVLAAAVSEVTDEINENSQVAVTWQDTIIGAMNAAASFARNEVVSAFQSMGIDLGAVWDFIVGAVKTRVNGIIGMYVYAAQASAAAWRTFPGAFMEFVIDAANGAIDYLEGMLNRGVGLLNAFAAGIEGITGVNVGRLVTIDLPSLEQNYRGATRIMRSEMGNARAALAADYLGSVAEFISPFAQQAAVDRLTGDAEEAGNHAGRALGRAAAAQIRDEVSDALKDAARLAAEVDDKNAQGETNRRDKIKEEAELQYRAQQDVEEEARRLGEERIQNLAGYYEALFSEGTGGVWRQFKREGIAAIAMIAAQWTVAMASGQSTSLGGIITGLFGRQSQSGGGGLFSGLLNSIAGARADGGPVTQGRTYLVGERGPELFMPQASGTIIPNQRMAAASPQSGGVATVRLMLSGDIDARIDQRSAGVAVEVVRASAGDIIDASAKETQRRLGRRTL